MTTITVETDTEQDNFRGPLQGYIAPAVSA
jgi:hypothetical protein